MRLDEITDSLLASDLKHHLRAWGISELTEVQVAAIKEGIADGESQIVCAPTSAGKTLVGEIGILAALKRGTRCLYLVSHKALADQKYVDFQNRFGDLAEAPLASVGLSTGDRDEGDIAPQILVATYEKALALLLSGQLDLGLLLVIADELQIINEDARGPNIETLCSIIKQKKVEQFVALTATVGNAQELADWLECKLVLSHSRDIDLYQEIWANGRIYSVKFGQMQGEEQNPGAPVPNDVLATVERLLAMGRGPVLVFTESRAEALRYARSYSASKLRTADGISVSERLELFSEPTESSQQLQNSAQRRVTFHTADLTSQERQVIEGGFLASSFDVCFATSTLAAGVNFPFRSVVFPKITYQYGGRQSRMIGKSDYRNMSGRAGRKGFHDSGYAILLPQNPRELSHANGLVLPENDNIDSKLVSLSMSRTVLSLISSQVVNSREALADYFQHTFYWHQIREKNPKKLDDVVSSAKQAVDWLVAKSLVDDDDSFLFPTALGKAVAQSGLMPTTAIGFLEVLKHKFQQIDDGFPSYIAGLMHWACQCDEFQSKKPSRFLPYPERGFTSSSDFLRSRPMLVALNQMDEKVNKCAHALTLFSQGESERIIRNASSIPSGQLHRLAVDVAWIIDGLRRITSVPDQGYPQTFTNKLGMLAREIQWGVPPEALDILRVAQKKGVPGFGRQRAVALLKKGIQTFEQILSSSRDLLISCLGNDRRVTALVEAAGSIEPNPDRFYKIHSVLSEKLGVAKEFDACSQNFGTAYEAAIQCMLEIEGSWKISQLDDGKQQNVPDIMIVLQDINVLIECKTTTKSPPLIKKEEAFAVLQKSIDYDNAMRRVTLGKPQFDEHSKKKAQGNESVTLVEHDVFMEGLLRVYAKDISPMEFLVWLSAPGVAEIDRIPGRPTYSIIRDLL